MGVSLITDNFQTCTESNNEWKVKDQRYLQVSERLSSGDRQVKDTRICGVHLWFPSFHPAWLKAGCNTGGLRRIIRVNDEVEHHSNGGSDSSRSCSLTPRSRATDLRWGGPCALGMRLMAPWRRGAWLGKMNSLAASLEDFSLSHTKRERERERERERLLCMQVLPAWGWIFA